MEEDVSCVTDKVNCPFKQYEKERFEHLSKALSKARDTRETEMKNYIDRAEISKANELNDCMSTYSLSKMLYSTWSKFRRVLVGRTVWDM